MRRLIALTVQEVTLAYQAAAGRFLRARRAARSFVRTGDSRDTAYRSVAEQLGHDVVGVLGEIAYAKLRGRYWAPTPALDYAGDVGAVHVRTTLHARGHLLVYEDEVPSPLPFVLIVLAPDLQTARLGGVLPPGTRPDGTCWREPPQVKHRCYWVPQEALCTEGVSG